MNNSLLTHPRLYFKFQPRAVSSSEDEDDLEPVYPGPICISCSGVDNDPLIWCSGCCEPFHYECAKGFPKSKYGTTYRWLCLDCRQSCISCSYPVLTISTFECKSCWRIIHRRCIDPQVRRTPWLSESHGCFLTFIARFFHKTFENDLRNLIFFYLNQVIGRVNFFMIWYKIACK